MREIKREKTCSVTLKSFFNLYDPIPKKFSKLITDRLTSKLTKHTKHVILGSMVIMPGILFLYIEELIICKGR
jgi:hypothetical protein